MKGLLASRITKLTVAALLTVVFASGCQTGGSFGVGVGITDPPDANTIHVPPGVWTYGISASASAKVQIDIAADCTVRLRAGSTIQPPGGPPTAVTAAGPYAVKAGSSIKVAANCEIDLPGGSTIHVPPGCDASKEGPVVRVQGGHTNRARVRPVRTMAMPPTAITHPGG